MSIASVADSPVGSTAAALICWATTTRLTPETAPLTTADMSNVPTVLRAAATVSLDARRDP